MDEPSDVTELLRAWGGGDQAALDRLTPVIYAELRRIAGGFMKREREGQTLQPTALANEAWIRLAGTERMSWQDRAHFFAVASTLMRRILVDAARARGTAKRGSGLPKVSLDDVAWLAEGKDHELIALDDALDTLKALDPRKVRVIELRFFGGLSVEETASVLEISAQSVMRDWKLARAFLMREMRGTGE